MRWNHSGQAGGAGRGLAAAFCRVHERWLNRALRSEAPYPRIPTRRVSEGGFSTLLSRPSGRVLADRWWEKAFEVVDKLD